MWNLYLEGQTRIWEFSRKDHAAGSGVCRFMLVHFPWLPNLFKRPLCLLAKRLCPHSKKKNLIEQVKFSDTTKIRNKFKEVKLRRKITADVVWLQSPKYLKPGLLSFRTWVWSEPVPKILTFHLNSFKLPLEEEVSRNSNNFQWKHLKNQSNLLCNFGVGPRPNFQPILMEDQKICSTSLVFLGPFPL